MVAVTLCAGCCPVSVVVAKGQALATCAVDIHIAVSEVYIRSTERDSVWLCQLLYCIHELEILNQFT